ncbi:hypothetical protein WJX73_007171 [Symbiochloris irregularis]|uniref:Uncharacterized protein n=1 Tax=Symbiochloris irregularis TaxID=706552 RepID=A0AAW1PDL2_9CHLO
MAEEDSGRLVLAAQAQRKPLYWVEQPREGTGGRLRSISSILRYVLRCTPAGQTIFEATGCEVYTTLSLARSGVAGDARRTSYRNGAAAASIKAMDACFRDVRAPGWKAPHWSQKLSFDFLESCQRDAARESPQGGSRQQVQAAACTEEPILARSKRQRYAALQPKQEPAPAHTPRQRSTLTIEVPSPPAEPRQEGVDHASCGLVPSPQLLCRSSSWQAITSSPMPQDWRDLSESQREQVLQALADLRAEKKAWEIERQARQDHMSRQVNHLHSVTNERDLLKVLSAAYQQWLDAANGEKHEAHARLSRLQAAHEALQQRCHEQHVLLEEFRQINAQLSALSRKRLPGGSA